MINIEYDKRGELKIFVDEDGANELKNYFSKLIEKKDTHYHLFTPSWGGYDLDEELLDQNCKLINQVLIQMVPNKK